MARRTMKHGMSRVGLSALLMATIWAAAGPTPGSAQSRPVVVKLATLAPSGSVWHEILLDMGEQWSRATGGQVTLRIYPGGVAGEEADVLRKMRIGQLHAGSLSLAGLQRITPWVNVLAIPMLMETREDLIRVRTAMEPRLEEVFRENGYVLLNWGDVGWMRYFLPTPDASVEACKRLKFVAWSDDAMLDLWRDEGFQNVVLNLSDVLPGLQTGLVDAIGSTPLWVISNQWFPFVPYMLDMPWAPLVGATVIDLEVWERIPAEHRPALMRIARETGTRFQEETERKEAEAIAAMEERGLKVIRPSPAIVAEWRALFESAYPRLRGELIPADWFDAAVEAAENKEGS